MNRPAPDGGGTATKPAARTVANHWDLGADTGGLTTLAGQWTTLHDAFTGERSTFTSKVSGTMPSWRADNGADFQHSYAGAQGDALTDMAGHCSSVATALTALATSLDGVQGKLDASLARLTSTMPHESLGLLGVDPFIVFHPEDDHDVVLIGKETKVADGLVEDAKEHVRHANAVLGKVPEGFVALKTGWQGEADGSGHRWTLHPSGSSSYRTVQTIGGTTIVSGNNTAEHVRVEIDPKTGETVLIFSRISQIDADPEPGDDHVDLRWQYTEEQRIRVPPGQEVVLNTGDGNDQVEVPEGVNVKLRILLGSGDDSLAARAADDRIEAFGDVGNDRITTGHGADFVSGGDGIDYLDSGASADQAFGGGGQDSLYGLDGDDLLSGGDGRDYLDGGSDDDRAFGGDDADVIGGGRDDDSLYGGSGDDTVYGGHGTDFADGGVSTAGDGKLATDDDRITIGREDTAFRDAETDTVITLEYDGSQGGFIQVQGSPEFQARVNSDLEFMRSTPTGQEMLRKLTELHNDEDGFWWWQDAHPYIISEYPRDKVGDNSDAWDAEANYRDDPPTEDAYCIRYRPEFQTLGDGDPNDGFDGTPPLLVLYHEMGHTYQFLSDTEASGRTLQEDGTTVNSIERQNVGLSYNDNDRGGDEEGLAPDEQEDPGQHAYRENGMRDEIRIPDRDLY